MATTSSKTNKVSDMFIGGVEWKASDFKMSPVVVETLDPVEAQSQIPSKVLLINDTFLHFNCAI